jgi:hypothetical protein
MKMGPDALGTAQNEYDTAQLENWTRRPRYHPKRFWERKTLQPDPAPSVPPKTSPVAQNMKMGLDALDIAPDESGSAKNKNGTQRRRFCPK